MAVPPFTMTPLIFELAQAIAFELGRLAGAKMNRPPVKLRRESKIKTIHASLAIEGNILDTDQITALLEGKRVLAPKCDITEVKNAIAVYSDLSEWNPVSKQSMLRAHKQLLNGLIDNNGKWRAGGVGVFTGSKVAHVAPPPKRVPLLMDRLFNFLKKDKATSWLVKACIFHYELEFIHPFSDGNGRMGRLWQQLLLMKVDPVFEYISVEATIKAHQKKYYQTLRACDQQGSSTGFIEFSLQQILEALRMYSSSSVTEVKDPVSRLAYAKHEFEGRWFSRKEYLQCLKDISAPTASRDLQFGVKQKLLQKKGEKNQMQYRFYSIDS